jgi:hypothetical protein
VCLNITAMKKIRNSDIGVYLIMTVYISGYENHRKVTVLYNYQSTLIIRRKLHVLSSSKYLLFCA